MYINAREEHYRRVLFVNRLGIILWNRLNGEISFPIDFRFKVYS